MVKAIKFILLSFLSGVAGISFGIVAADLYDYFFIPYDPDPVDFTSFFVLLGVSTSCWLIGTMYTGWAVYFRRPNQSFKPNPLRGSA